MKYSAKCSNLFVDISNNITSVSSNILLSFGVINSVLAVPTAAANALVIVAILKTSSLRTPSYLLLANLAFSDLAIGLLGQPILSAFLLTFVNEKIRASCYITALYYGIWGYTLWASLFTITAISVDRYLAIRLKMRYRSVVTIRRTKRVVVSIWILAFFAMTSPFLFETGVNMYGILAGVGKAVLLSVILFCYMMSFRALKIHCAQTHPQGNQQPNNTIQSNAIDVLKYRKLLKTMVLIVVVILICYLPLTGISVILSVAPDSNRLAELQVYMASVGLPVLASLISIMNLNSILNPVICMTRMRELRQAGVQILKNAFSYK